MSEHAERSDERDEGQLMHVTVPTTLTNMRVTITQDESAATDLVIRRCGTATSKGLISMENIPMYTRLWAFVAL